MFSVKFTTEISSNDILEPLTECIAVPHSALF